MGFKLTPQVLKAAQAYSQQYNSPLHKAGRAIENTGMGAVNDINNLFGGAVHGVSVPVAGAENLIGDVAAHVPLLHGAGKALQNVRPLMPLNYDPTSGLGEAGNVGAQLLGPAPELDVASHIPQAVGAIASKVPLGEKAVGDILNRTATNASTGAVYANPNQRLSGAVGGAVGGQLIDSAFHAPTHIRNLARHFTEKTLQKIAHDASQHMGSLRTPEQVANLDKQIGDMPLNFGEVIHDPDKAKILYNEAWLPFSGQKKTGAKLVGHVHEFANNLMQELGGGVEPGKMARTVRESVQKNAEQTEAKSKELYGARDALAQANNVQIPLTHFMEAANKIKKNPGWLKTPEGVHVKNILDDLKTNELNAHLQKGADPRVDFENAHFATSGLKKAARAYEKMGNLNGVRLMTQLHAGLEKDLNTELASHPELLAAHNAAQEHFLKNVVPYREKPIRNIIKNRANLKSLNSTLLNSNHEKVLADLPETAKKQLLFNILKRKLKPTGDNQFKTTAQRLSTGYGNLDPDDISRLISPELQQKFAHLKSLNDVSETAQARYKPPNTGYQTNKTLVKVLEGLGIGGAAKAAGAVKAAAILPALAAIQRKRLAFNFSPEIRRAYIAGKVKRLEHKPLNKIQKTLKKAAILGGNQAIAGGNL